MVEELARCLALFPNLHTLQILGRIEGQTHAKFKAFFSKITLPGVRTLVVSTPAAVPVIASCPGVTRLIPLNTYRLQDISINLGSLPCLEQLEHIYLDKPDLLSAFSP